MSLLFIYLLNTESICRIWHLFLFIHFCFPLSLSRMLLFVLDPNATTQNNDYQWEYSERVMCWLIQLDTVGNRLITVSVNAALRFWSARFTDCSWRVEIQFHPVCSRECFTRVNFAESQLKHCHQMNKVVQILLNEFFEQSTDGWAWWS